GPQREYVASTMKAIRVCHDNLGDSECSRGRHVGMHLVGRNKEDLGPQGVDTDARSTHRRWESTVSLSLSLLRRECQCSSLRHSDAVWRYGLGCRRFVTERGTVQNRNVCGSRPWRGCADVDFGVVFKNHLGNRTGKHAREIKCDYR